MKSVSIIRDHGQLTIPDFIRKMITWLKPMSAVIISVIKPDEIVIKPHQSYINQEKVWDLIKKSRVIKGEGKGSASQFLMEDRNTH